MHSRMRRGKGKVLPKREGKKSPKPKHSLRLGQGIRLKGQGGVSTFIRNAKAPGKIIVKIRETHPRKRARKEEREAALLEVEASKLLRRIDFLNLQPSSLAHGKDAREIDEIWSKLMVIRRKLKALEKAPSNVTLTKVEKVKLSDVISKKRKSPRFVRVSAIERKKMRRASLIKLARKRYKTKGARLKFLRKRGIRPKREELE